MPQGWDSDFFEGMADTEMCCLPVAKKFAGGQN